MRLAVTVGQDKAGKWHTLATPDKGVEEQKKLLDTLQNAKGIFGKGKDKIDLARVILLTTSGQVKRRKFGTAGVLIAAERARELDAKQPEVSL